MSRTLQVVAQKCYDFGVMNTTQTTEYRVQLFHYSNGSTERWSASVIAMPYITAEGASRAAVLEEIRRKLVGAIANTEIVAVSLSSDETPRFPDETPAEKRLREKGYHHYGIFANDPGALEVFDEIERRRDQFTLGHLNNQSAAASVADPSAVEDDLTEQEAAA